MAYVSDKQEMLQQCFRVLGEKKLRKMLPDELKVRILYIQIYLNKKILHVFCHTIFPHVDQYKLKQIFNYTLTSSVLSNTADVVNNNDLVAI